MALTELTAQNDILSAVFSFRNGEVKKGNALNIISRKTGYYFTYDSRIINTEEKVILNSDEKALEEILRDIVKIDSIRFSIIGNNIIIARSFTRPAVSGNLTEEEEVYRVAGRIVDSETGEPLPFATVAIRNKPRGTVANIDGYFSLAVPMNILTDTLTVSYLGFLNRLIPLSETLGNDFTISMFRDYIPIPEIIIRSQIPQEIIKRAVLSIPANYGTTPASLWAFYREGVRKGKELQVYSEAVLNIYKAPYTSPSTDQAKVIRSRKAENVSSSDTLMLRLRAGLNSSLYLDGIKNLFEFFDEEFMDLYNYQMTDIVTIDDEAAFVIEFVQKEHIKEPLYRGSVMINTVDYALIQAEFELHPSYISRRNETFITSPLRGFNVRPVSVKYRTSYKKSGDRYFLNHVRGDLRFAARKKRSLFSSSFDVFFELAVTQSDINNVTRFDRKEVIPLESVFSRTVSGYDPDFWGEFDFLNPEEDLLKSMNSISLRLSRYLEDNR